MATCRDCKANKVCDHNNFGFENCGNYIPEDVAEVKHGEWYLLDECANEGVYCSVCHKKVYGVHYANQKLKSNYCPNCGAKMDGGNNG
jgi:hypothetical protein